MQRIPAAAIYTEFVMAELREAGAARGLEPFDDPRQWARAFDADAQMVFGVALCRPAHVARGPLDTLPPPATAVRDFLVASRYHTSPLLVVRVVDVAALAVPMTVFQNYTRNVGRGFFFELTQYLFEHLID